MHDRFALLYWEKQLPKMCPGTSVVWVTTSSQACIARCANPGSCDLLLLDENLQGKKYAMQGYKVARCIRKMNGSISIIGMATYQLEKQAALWADAGVQGIINKSVNRSELSCFLREVLEHGVDDFSPLGRGKQCFQTPQEAHSSVVTNGSTDRELSANEKYVLHKLASGLCCKEIAKLLNVKTSSVHTHLHRAKAKIGGLTIHHALLLWWEKERLLGGAETPSDGFDSL